MKLTNDDVQEILRLLDGSDYDELHLQTDRFALSLKRSNTRPGGWGRETRTLGEASVTQLQEAELPQQEQATEPSATDATRDGLLEIRTPMVGTFYRAPKPGAEPFVKVGSVVDEHTVIAIVEVMKLMNSIAAGVSGEIVEILAEDAQFVEKGQLLMRVKPAG